MNNKKVSEWMDSRKQQREIRKVEPLFLAIREGDITALSAAITLLESTLQSDQELARELISRCLPFSGKSIRIGITGVPGVGKSTFIESFGKKILESSVNSTVSVTEVSEPIEEVEVNDKVTKRKIAVLAIDPTSERTGGSILGDKTRMEELSKMDGVFIRPSAAGSSLGGVARKTRESIILCEACGFDVILIETVGVGQSETVAHSMVDFFLLLLLAGAGDELQGIKRGIMEMADGLVVTKADGDNEKKAEFAARELKNAIHLFPPTSNNWIPEVKTCSAITETRILAIWEMIEKFQMHTQLNGYFQQKRHQQDRYWLHETLKELLLEGLNTNQNVVEHLAKVEKEVVAGTLTPFEAAEQLYTIYLQRQ